MKRTIDGIVRFMRKDCLRNASYCRKSKKRFLTCIEKTNQYVKDKVLAL